MLIEQANITPVASNMSKIKKLSFDLRSMYTEVATEKANERMIEVKAEHHHIGAFKSEMNESLNPYMF